MSWLADEKATANKTAIEAAKKIGRLIVKAKAMKLKPNKICVETTLYHLFPSLMIPIDNLTD